MRVVLNASDAGIEAWLLVNPVGHLAGYDRCAAFDAVPVDRAFVGEVEN